MPINMENTAVIVIWSDFMVVDLSNVNKSNNGAGRVCLVKILLFRFTKILNLSTFMKMALNFFVNFNLK